LFVGSGQSLAIGGPASLLIAYLVIGAVLFCTVQALGEMAVTFPVAGSFSAFATRFLDPAWGFASGWNYALQWMFVMPLEIMSAAITLEYWNLPIPAWASISIFLLIIITINLSGVKTYGEAEYTFSILKVTAVIGFMYVCNYIFLFGPLTMYQYSWSRNQLWRRSRRGLHRWEELG
jgi:amino acid transporter